MQRGWWIPVGELAANGVNDYQKNANQHNHANNAKSNNGWQHYLPPWPCDVIGQLETDKQNLQKTGKVNSARGT